jgi:hypothetical protein
MPSRPVTLAIVLFWLAAAGWFLAHDALPKWRTGGPPPYTIELPDEAQGIRVPFRWVCTFNGRKIGTVRTAIGYRPSDDTYELSATCQTLALPVLGPLTVTASEFEDLVRVTRDGELRSLSTSGKVAVALGGLAPAGGSGRFVLSAEARRGRLERHVLFDVPGQFHFEPPLPPAEAPRGTILNPMHPVPRITGLRPGQTWRQPLVDPRPEILRAALEQAKLSQMFPLPKSPEALTAMVLSEPQFLETESQVRRCLVIEYRDGEDYTARTWVQESDGTVVRQEAGSHGDVLILQKE